MAHYLYAKAMQQALPRKLRPAVSVEACCFEENVLDNLKMNAGKRRAEARRDRTPFDVIWLLFDQQPGAFQQSLLGEQHDVRFAYAPVCLERWFLLHFEAESNVVDAETATADLRRFWPEYKRGKVDAYGELLSRMPIAIQRANDFCSWDSYQVSVELLGPPPLFTIQKLLEHYKNMSIAA